MTNEQGLTLKIGDAVEYAPSVIHGRPTDWFGGVVAGSPRWLGNQGTGTVVVAIDNLSAAYGVATGRPHKDYVSAAVVSHVRRAVEP